jgi:hypothetical protein
VDAAQGARPDGWIWWIQSSVLRPKGGVWRTGCVAWMAGLEGMMIAIFSPQNNVHEGVFKVQNGVFS